jgi:hypothetical protein
MSEFVVETYAPCETTSLVASRLDEVALAAEQVSEAGAAEVRLLQAILVPEEETCFYLYESSSADDVREALTRARLRFERISEAVSIRPGEAPARTPHATT